MKMSWKNYEHYIYYTFKNKYPESDITFNKKIKGLISGRSRQIDLFIEGIIAGEKLTIIIDCKYFNKKIDIKIVESFLSFVKDVKGNRGILITNKGFTKSAYNRAHNDQNVDVKLEIIDFKQLFPFQGHGAIIHRGCGGALISPPDGWIIEGKKFDSNILATILPYGLSINNAFHLKEVLFCNIMPKEDGLTVDKIIADQEEGRLEFDNQSTVNIEPIILKRYDKLNGISRNIYYPQAGYYDYTIFLDFEKFIFYACLIEGTKIKGKYQDNLHFVVNYVMPLNVQEDIHRRE